MGSLVRFAHNWNVGLPWPPARRGTILRLGESDLAGISCCCCNILEPTPTELRPCKPGLGQGILQWWAQLLFVNRLPCGICAIRRNRLRPALVPSACVLHTDRLRITHLCEGIPGHSVWARGEFHRVGIFHRGYLLFE